MPNHSSTAQVKWTDEMIIDLIRKVRNDLIKDFLDERFLSQYADVNFNIKQLSPVKIEFIKASLKELLISPVNISHYQPIIEQVKTTDSASLTDGNDTYFYKEIENVLKRYIY
jgi:hypothetical protein